MPHPITPPSSVAHGSESKEPAASLPRTISALSGESKSIHILTSLTNRLCSNFSSSPSYYTEFVQAESLFRDFSAAWNDARNCLDRVSWDILPITRDEQTRFRLQEAINAGWATWRAGSDALARAVAAAMRLGQGDEIAVLGELAGRGRRDIEKWTGRMSKVGESLGGIIQEGNIRSLYGSQFPGEGSLGYSHSSGSPISPFNGSYYYYDQQSGEYYEVNPPVRTTVQPPTPSPPQHESPIQRRYSGSFSTGYGVEQHSVPRITAIDDRNYDHQQGYQPHSPPRNNYSYVQPSSTHDQYADVHKATYSTAEYQHIVHRAPSIATSVVSNPSGRYVEYGWPSSPQPEVNSYGRVLRDYEERTPFTRYL